MKFSIQVRPEVESDIREAAAWYERKQLGLGVEFEEEIAAGVIGSMKMPSCRAFAFAFCKFGGFILPVFHTESFTPSKATPF